MPASEGDRVSSAWLLERDDADLIALWESALRAETAGSGFGLRGWYHALYEPLVRGKRLLDIGCGLGFSSITFAQMGAHVTFTDLIPENVRVVERICRLKNIDAEYLTVDRIDDFGRLPMDYEIVTALGSLINAPMSVTRAEVSRILPHLADGCRWLHLSYPRTRWLRDGRPPFWAWGIITDGRGTPWVEYHDRNKVLSLFEGVDAKVLFECEWHNNEFNWFDVEISKTAAQGASSRVRSPLR